MHPTLPALALALALLPFATTFQERPKGPVQEPAKQPLRSPAVVEAERIRGELLGTWELTRTEVGGNSYAGNTCRGYLVVQAEYCALQVRLVSMAPGGRDMAFAGLTAGTYRWTYDEARLMFSLSTLMQGSDMERLDGVVMYEAQGTQRDYEITVGGNDLTLTRRAGQIRMFFRRLQRDTSALPPATGAGAPPKQR